MPAQTKTYFADLILPIPLPRPYTYRVPRHLEGTFGIGCRVVVLFGKRRVVTGVCLALHEAPPTEYEAKLILDALEAEPSVLPLQLQLFTWMAAYYCCAIGEAVFAALPSGLKLSSESRLQVNPDADLERAASDLTLPERLALDAIAQAETLSFDELTRNQEIEYPAQVIKQLLAKRLVLAYEQVRERYTPRMIRMLALSDALARDPDAMEGALVKLARAPRQREALLHMVALLPVSARAETWIEKARLLADANITTQSVRSLIDGGYLLEREQVISRLPEWNVPDVPIHQLSGPQQLAADRVHELWAQGLATVLLHGITGSGKTEVYIYLIQQALAAGGQVLYLLPEIALTTQIVARLRKIFGDSMGIYHSRFSDNERVEVWRGLIEGRFSFIIGVRSAVMLPFANLALIVVDEEHEATYKQQEPAPRYHGRDVALVLARMHNAKTLLGSATPSIESYYMARSGAWGLVELLERYGDAVPPTIHLIDVRAAQQRRQMQGAFSPDLLRRLREAVSIGEQAILFQNRRGFAPYLSCRECGWIPKCENCDVSLTYHQAARQIRCHYCGHAEPVPTQCRACASPEVRPIGLGTEKLEEEAALLLPDARVVRMDQDTTRRKNALQDIISQFERGEADILVGTQMVTKGLDFDRVNLVGIFDVDRLIHFPEFRAHERAFQTITQVAGRAGRKSGQGQVLIQTRNPAHPIMHQIVEGDYRGFYEAELPERERYHYPPFMRIIRITLRHEDKETLPEPAAWLAARLRLSLSEPAVLGPEPPLIERIRNLYAQELHIKLPREGTDFAYAKRLLQEAIAQIPKFRGRSELRITVDVDPV